MKIKKKDKIKNDKTWLNLLKRHVLDFSDLLFSIHTKIGVKNWLMKRGMIFNNVMLFFLFGR
jgi:hypothetical protein